MRRRVSIRIPVLLHCNRVHMDSCTCSVRPPPHLRWTNVRREGGMGAARGRHGGGTGAARGRHESGTRAVAQWGLSEVRVCVYGLTGEAASYNMHMRFCGCHARTVGVGPAAPIPQRASGCRLMLAVGQRRTARYTELSAAVSLQMGKPACFEREIVSMACARYRHRGTLEGHIRRHPRRACAFLGTHHQH